MRFAGIGTIVALLLLAALPAAVVAAPACGEPPEVVGNTIYGTPCADTIRLPRAITTVFGEGGDDVLFGQRGNDRLYGGEGNDRLYGGVGDDRLRGGPGDDLLSGGFGADNLDGEEGGDFLRGDATIDVIADSGSTGADTLSYSTGVTPGFTNQGSFFDYAGFPAQAAGRGVFIDLEDPGAPDGNGFAHDGDATGGGGAPAGGGVDVDLDGESFERVVGSPFPDFIVGSTGAEEIYGGGGADVILGEGGADLLHGGAEGDYCAGAGATLDSSCEHTGGDKAVDPDGSGLTAGQMTPPGVGPPALYLIGGAGADALVATYSEGPPRVSFTAGGSPAGSFTLAQPPDSVLVAGLGGGDTIAAVGFPATTSLIALGGDGDDSLLAGDTEDALVDGPGDDVVDAGGGDDAVPNNGGEDELHAGSGEDLFISNSVCEGDLLDGGPDRDNANWANFGSAVAIDMAAREAGLVGPAGEPQCGGNPATTLEAIEDIEGTSHADTLVGDEGPNQLLGRFGADTYRAGEGNDTILANSADPENPGDSDPLIECGEGWDTALIDIPTAWTLDGPLLGCEDVEERAPNSFRPPGTPPDPNPPTETSPTSPTSGPATPEARQPRPKRPPRPDVKAPQTRIVSHPRAQTWTARRTRRVAFRFVANEAAARLRCRIDRGRFRPCRSPRRYRVRTGAHTFRVYAIDAAGNRDRTPARFSFRVRRR